MSLATVFQRSAYAASNELFCDECRMKHQIKSVRVLSRAEMEQITTNTKCAYCSHNLAFVKIR